MTCKNIDCGYTHNDPKNVQQHEQTCPFARMPCTYCHKQIAQGLWIHHLNNHLSNATKEETKTKQTKQDYLTNVEQEKEEFLLQENPDRFVLFPLRYDQMWEMYKRAEASVWHAAEVANILPHDRVDWEEKLTVQEQFFIKNVLGFFASGDSIVMENLSLKFLCEVQIPEAKFFYGFQLFIEQVHSETYSILIDTYVDDEAEKTKLFHAVTTVPSIKRKAEWALKWITSDSSFGARLVAWACVEGIFFSSAFCSIFWLKKRGLMKGLTFSNELISRDEGLHCDFACLLYSTLKYKLSAETVTSIIREAVAAEHEFVKESLPVAIIGMNAEHMSRYVEFCADRLLEALGYEKYFKAQNPFDWMELISLQGKSNFFEQPPSEYQATSVLSESNKQQKKRSFKQADKITDVSETQVVVAEKQEKKSFIQDIDF